MVKVVIIFICRVADCSTKSLRNSLIISPVLRVFGRRRCFIRNYRVRLLCSLRNLWRRWLLWAAVNSISLILSVLLLFSSFLFMFLPKVRSSPNECSSPKVRSLLRMGASPKFVTGSKCRGVSSSLRACIPAGISVVAILFSSSLRGFYCRTFYVWSICLCRIFFLINRRNILLKITAVWCFLHIGRKRLRNRFYNNLSVVDCLRIFFKHILHLLQRQRNFRLLISFRKDCSLFSIFR